MIWCSYHYGSISPLGMNIHTGGAVNNAVVSQKKALLNEGQMKKKCFQLCLGLPRH